MLIVETQLHHNHSIMEVTHVANSTVYLSHTFWDFVKK